MLSYILEPLLCVSWPDLVSSNNPTVLEFLNKIFIFLLNKLLLGVCLSIRVSIVVSIPACHAGDRGSIPRHGEFFLSMSTDFVIYALSS